MFRQSTQRSTFTSAISIVELIYHSIVRNIRKTHNNAIIGLISNMMQTVVFVGTFYIMFAVLGLRGTAIRGDFLLYIMSGIFLYMTHIKAIGAVAGSEGPTSAMMKHAPMTTAISITAAALGSLYIQVLSVLVILFIYHVAFAPVEIYDPVGAFAMLLLAWFTGCAVGMVFLALKPWLPGFVGLVQQVYTRANMIASGKMFVANQTPAHILVFFSWNPLFHAIDQCRGYAFANYNPHNSSISYAMTVAIVLIMLGLMGEFFTRKHASASWGAGS